MNENEPNFESLRRLLALKRHEMPPPRYFDSFSSQVIARIRAGEAGTPASPLEHLFGQIPWLLESLQTFEMKPVFAGAYASALCLLLAAGVIFAERPESTSQASGEPTPQIISSFTSATTAALPQPVNQTLIADNSINPMFNFQSTPSSFGQILPGAQLVDYSLPGN
ncbi:MAG: hypothetical protein ABSD77_06000 [Verrucomicrobiota bacterium]|jgi:hypothetical protein